MITREQCRGCEDDFYNSDRSTTGRCWSSETGKMVTRYQIGTWTEPARPGAFTEVKRPSCYRQKGSAFYDKLPSFVKAADVVRLRDRR